MRAWRRLRARPVLAAFLLYTLLAVVFFAPGLLPGHATTAADYLWTAAPWNGHLPKGVKGLGSNGELVDPVTVLEPFLQHTRAALPHIPLWNPYVMAGRPFEANMQSAIFSPFSLPAYVLPFWWSLSLIAVLKVLVAAMGTFLLGRALDMRFAGAFLAGVVYALGLYLVVWIPFANAAVWVLLPWLLLATERLIRRPDGLSVAALAALVALQYFGGHPESSFHVMFATVAFFVLRVLQVHWKDWKAAAGDVRGRAVALARQVRRPTAVFAMALVGGAALAAVTIVPFLELVGHSKDLSNRPRAGVYMEPKFLLAALLPDYWGRPTQTPLPGSFEVQRASYAGALPLMLAAAALIVRPRLQRVAIAVFGVVMFAVVAGLPPFFQIVRALPGFNSTYNTRLVILYLFSIALLAGWGLDDLVAARPRGRRAVAIAALAASLLALPLVYMVARGRISLGFLGDAFDVAWGFARPPTADKPTAEPIVHLAALILWLTLAGAGLALLIARLQRRLPAGTFGAVAIVLVCADLFRAGMGQNPAIRAVHAEQPATPAIRYLQGHRPARFAGVAPKIGVIPFPPDISMRYGLFDARGYDFPVEGRYDDVWRRYVAPQNSDHPPTLVVDVNPRSLRVLSLFGVRDILQQRPDQPPLHGPGLRVGYNGPDATIYENDRALPRAWVTGSQQLVRGEDAALQAIAAPGFDARRVVVTERRLPHLPAGDPGGAPAGSARLVSAGAERVSIRVRATRHAEVVLSDVSYPGWEARVDGRRTRLDRVNYLFRGIPVAAGDHRVELTYRPASWRIGWIVSLLAALALAATAVLALARRRRSGRPPAGPPPG
jgi:hypothetical protein